MKNRLSLLNRLQTLEQMMIERTTPNQEELVAAYLREILAKDTSLETITGNYEKVKEFVPKMH